MEIKTVFNAVNGIKVNDEVTILRSDFLFMFAAASVVSKYPAIREMDSTLLMKFDNLAGVAIKYQDVRAWFAVFCDSNLTFRRMFNEEVSAREFRSFILRSSIHCSEAKLIEYHNDSETIEFTEAGIALMQEYGNVFDREWFLIERLILDSIDSKYAHCGMTVENRIQHVPTMHHGDLSQYVMRECDIASAVYHRMDGTVLVNLYGVGTFIVERLYPFDCESIVNMADEGWGSRTMDEVRNEYHARYGERSEKFKIENGLNNEDDDIEYEEATDNDRTAMKIASLLGQALGKKPVVTRIDISKDRVKLTNLDESEDSAEETSPTTIDPEKVS